jgi:glycosyltransferase involved in cell wall biosynthesis
MSVNRFVMRCPSIDDLPLPSREKVGWLWTEGGQQDVNSSSISSVPRISIVMPSFNQVQFIEEAIRSVLLQGYDDLEFMIMDGGSTDGTVDIIRKYEPWLAFWVSEQDKGQADALRKGFGRSTGAVLAWLNSDDMYCEGALRSIGLYYHRYPDTGLVYGDSDVIDADGAVIDSIRGEEGDLERLLTRNIISQPSAFFSRQAFEKAGGINPDLHFIMDYELWIRMMLQGVTSHYLPECLSRFRWYRISKSGSYSTQFGYEYLSFLERIFQERPDERLTKTRLPAFHYAFMMIMACNGRGADDDDIAKALGLWMQHLEQYQADYLRSPELWADSLYRIGDAYCLRGDIKTGRTYFSKSLGVSKTIHNLAFPGRLVSYLGQGIYRRYAATCRAILPYVRRWR